MSRGRSDDVKTMQARAWGYWGYPGSTCRAVGEVHYVDSWMADQMTRLEWDVSINGNDSWSVTQPDGSVISTAATAEDGEEDQTEASTQLLELIDWTDTNVRGVSSNLFVAGQGDYAQFKDDGWRVVSTIETDREKKLKKALAVVPFIKNHPADPSKPDAPLFSVLEVLDELDWLNRQARTQSKQRVLFNGLIATADGFEGPDGEEFWQVWNATLSARMTDPDDMSPVRLKGPLDLIKDGINWIVPPFGYDEVIDRRIVAAIQRLAYGLPIPPEILLGMQAQSRATAFQVEENAYRAHIEPPAMLVAQVAQDALNSILDDEFEVTVTPNPSNLLARRNSVEDTKWAWENGLASDEFTREVLNIPQDAAGDGVIKGDTTVAADPSNVAADEPVAASASSGSTLSDLLADIDAALSSELAGATVMATDRARQRLGAAARASDTTLRSDPDYKGLSNADLATSLSYDGLLNAGVDVAHQIGEPIDAAARWWTRRVSEAWAQATMLVPGWAGQGDWITESVDALAEALTVHIVDTLAVVEPPPLDAESIRTVVDRAAGSVPAQQAA